MLEFKTTDIPNDVMAIIRRLKVFHFKAFIVGGAVRDLMLGKTPKDFDITTDAMPNQILGMFKHEEETFKVSDVDAKLFHVVIVNGIEVATFRQDIHDDNGNTIDTIPLDNIESDLARRDLTINAIALDPITGEVVDPFGGRNDLITKTISFVGDAQRRINEDPNRILRAFRFFGDMGKIDPIDFSILSRNVDLIDTIAPERIRLEVLKAMSTSKPSKFFEGLAAIDGLKKIFPDLAKTFNLDGGKYHDETVFRHSMLAGDQINTTNPMLRLTAFLHDIGKSDFNMVEDEIHFYGHENKGSEMIEANLKALTFKNSEIKFAKNLVLVHMRNPIKAAPKTIRKMLKKFAELDVDWRNFLQMVIADKKSNLLNDKRKHMDKGRIKMLFTKFRDEVEGKQSKDNTAKPAFEVKQLAISGGEVKRLLGIKPSPFVGGVLDWLLNEVIRNPEHNTPEGLRKLLGK